MFGSRRWRLNASLVSAIILRGFLNYGIFMGIICFSVKKMGYNGHLVAQNRKWYKWFCLISRIVMCVNFVEIYKNLQFSLNASYITIIVIIRLYIYIACAVFTLVVQFCYGQQVVELVNRFLRLFQRIHMLPGCQDMGYGGKWVLTLLLLKVLSMMHEICYLIPSVLLDFNKSFALLACCDLYNYVNASIIWHIYFVAYLSISVLYDQINCYVRHELRQQLSELKPLIGVAADRRKLNEADCRLDKCLAIYDEIHQVGNTFHRIFEFPLCVNLMFGFLILASSAFLIINNSGDDRLWFTGFKVLLDILLLTVAVHNASSNSKVVRLLSLENYYVGQNKDWNMKLEMFLCRLNYNEFRVRPLGLFEVSNELILVFISGLVTYLTYIIQYDMQSNPTLN